MNAQVYTEHLDNTGHTIGPETDRKVQAVRDLDKTLLYLQNKLQEFGLENEGRNQSVFTLEQTSNSNSLNSQYHII